MKGTAERDIADMEDCINALDDAAGQADAVVSDEIVSAMRKVVIEWRDYTKPLLKELAQEDEE